MKKKIFFAIIILIVIFFIVDYYRFKNNKLPIFALSNSNMVYKDGGSRFYYGFGYKVLKCNTLSGDESMKFGFYNMKYSCESSNVEKKSCDNDLNLITEEENKYYSDPDKLSFPFTVEIKEKDDCDNHKELYYKETKINGIGDEEETDYFLYCLDEVIINFSNRSVTLKEALENKEVTIDDIINKIPYQVHLYYGESSYIHSSNYGFAKNGLSIYHTLNRYFIGPLRMCDDGSFSAIDIGD